jgi:hypothetical protein
MCLFDAACIAQTLELLCAIAVSPAEISKIEHVVKYLPHASSLLKNGGDVSG